MVGEISASPARRARTMTWSLCEARPSAPGLTRKSVRRAVVRPLEALLDPLAFVADGLDNDGHFCTHLGSSFLWASDRRGQSPRAAGDRWIPTRSATVDSIGSSTKSRVSHSERRPFCSVSRGQRRLGEKEYRAPSVTPGVALRPRTQDRPRDSFSQLETTVSRPFRLIPLGRYGRSRSGGRADRRLWA
jgi:hypothetical protein